MGCGKTTLGRALGAMSTLNFVDLDSLIVARTHRTIAEIFAHGGESEFRSIERGLLAELAETEDVVVACGGGTPCFFDNMELMNRSGITVFMDTSRDCLLRRLKIGRRKRPLIAGMNDVELESFAFDLLARRRPHYEKARAVFSGDLLETRDEITLSARRFIESFNLPQRNEH